MQVSFDVVSGWINRAQLWVVMLCLALLPGGAAMADGGAMDRVMDTVLTVRSNDSSDRFLGSAFLWGTEAVVAVTNAHVVGETEEVRLVDRHGHEEVGLVIARDVVRDVAVIAIAPGADGMARRGLALSELPVQLGMEVFALGAPLGLEFTLTEGLISATERQVETAVPIRMVQHDAAVNPGSSGGPLVDAQGALVGMNSQIADGSRMFVGIAYAIPAPDLARIVTGLIDETLPAFPALGMQARPVDRKVAALLDVAPKGLLIDSVAKGGLVDLAGLLPGDIILAVGGVELAQPGDLAFLIEAAQAAGASVLTIRREGALQDLTVGLEAADGEDGALGVKRREVDLSAAPARIASYPLTALGVVLDDQGRISDITDTSPALFAGLARGDRILAVNGEAIDVAGLNALEITAPVLVRVQAPGGVTRHIFLDPWGGEGGLRPVGGANVLDPDVIVF